MDKIKFKTRERKTQQAKAEQEEKALPEELREPFLRALNTDRFMKAFCLASMFAGLRPGEVFALKWKDIDFQQNTLLCVHTAVQLYLWDVCNCMQFYANRAELGRFRALQTERQSGNNSTSQFALKKFAIVPDCMQLYL